MADADPTPTPGPPPSGWTTGARRRQVLAWCATALALVAVVAGFIVTGTVVVVRQRVLDEATYTGALADAEVYDRGQLPHFVAVDFYGIGDVLAAVDELNGITG